MSTRYHPEVHSFIVAHVEGCTAKDLAELVNAEFGTEFTAASMKSYKANHKLKSGTPCGLPKGRPTDLYPAHVTEYIKTHYKGTNYAKMAVQLKETFGVEYTPNQIMGYYKNHKLNSGLTGRFEKGHVPPNKGKKGYYAPGCEKGWFRKGNTPWDTAPVGTVVVREGYLWKKLTNKPDGGRFNWKQLHLILWEEAYGPVPEGFYVAFKDGNPQNCTLDNLMLVSKAENIVMNRWGLRYNNPEYAETGLLIAKVKIAAGPKRRKDNERT